MNTLMPVLTRPATSGVVTNWTLVSLNHDTQSCMDPNVIESKVIARHPRVMTLSCLETRISGMHGDATALAPYIYAFYVWWIYFLHVVSRKEK